MSKPTCECGLCGKCLHRAFVRRQRIRERIGWLTQAQRERRLDRFMSNFASVYWGEVYRRGVPSFRLKPFRN